MYGILVVVAALGGLMYLAYRGVTLLILAPGLAMFAVLAFFERPLLGRLWMTPMDRHNMTVAMIETRQLPESGELHRPDEGMVAVASRLADPCLIVDRLARLHYVNPVAIQMFGAIE